MIPNLNNLRTFVQAVESGGFAAAARLTGVPKSTISKRVAELENDLGARLINRTSRSFTLTDVGREFYDRARASVIEAEAATDVVRRRLAEPVGTVRITCSVPVAQFHLADRLPILLERYPKIDVQVQVSDRFVDLAHEGFDIAIRSHQSPLPNSDLVQRVMSMEHFILVAAPKYVARSGLPEKPEDLADHDSIFASQNERTWRLANTAGDMVEVESPSRLTVDEAGTLLQSVKAGLGVACLPENVARPSLDRGELVSVLPDWSGGTITTTVLTTHRRGQLPAVRSTVGFLTERTTSGSVL